MYLQISFFEARCSAEGLTGKIAPERLGNMRHRNRLCRMTSGCVSAKAGILRFLVCYIFASVVELRLGHCSN